MKRFSVAGALALAAVYFAASALPAFGDSSGNVTGSVTVGAPCVTVDPAQLNFGVLGFSREGAVQAGATSHALTNCGSAAERVSVAGSNATSTAPGSSATWSLVAGGGKSSPCSDGTNAYWISVQNVAGSEAALLTTGPQSFANLAPGGVMNPSVTLYMPCAGSGGAGETMTFSINYVASF